MFLALGGSGKLLVGGLVGVVGGSVGNGVDVCVATGDVVGLWMGVGVSVGVGETISMGVTSVSPSP